MKENKSMIRLTNVVLRLPELQFRQPLNWELLDGQQWAIIGPNGSGKSLFADLLQKKLALKSGEITYGFEGPVSQQVKSISFKDIYSLTDGRNTYYQQRWHSTESDEIKTVEETLDGLLETEQQWMLLSLFGMENLLSKRLIYLSSGELRKFLIARVLLTAPRILILDNPFIGLDAASRNMLVEMLTMSVHLKKTQILLLLADPADIPESITHVLPLQDRRVYPSETREAFLADPALQRQLFPRKEAPQLPAGHRPASSHHLTFRMEHVSIRYGNRTILKEVDWEVKNGEKWALSGPNGAGKSTLLSLIYADNPQSYANTLYLFDRKRGSGESIWDIKKRIGYVSPEMHLFYRENVPALQVVGSGFFDSVGLYRKCNEEQQQATLEWMRLFGIETLKDRLFLTLSSGEQRLALLARAFVKDPDLIILDEPLHGLDVSAKAEAIQIIEQFCSRPGKTLIFVTHYLHELPPCVDKQFELTKHT